MYYKKSSLLLALLACLFFSPILFGQISPTPENVDTTEISAAELQAAFSRLHQYSDYIYRSKKISEIDAESYKESSETWEKGSWGRGYFSRYVDAPLYNGKKDISKDYQEWYLPYNKNVKDEAQFRYWSSYPLIRDTARRLTAYIRAYQANPDSNEFKTLIEDGLRYLVKQHSVNTSSAREGAFVYWRQRPAENLPNTDALLHRNYGNEYTTGLAIRALVEGYYFGDRYGWETPSLKDSILQTVIQSANWLMTISLNYDEGSYDQRPATPSGHVINYRSFALWGLVSAYQLTHDSRYLNRAFNLYAKNIKNYQAPDGAWYYNWASSTYHDTKSFYMGIILRGLVSLYSVTPANYDTDWFIEQDRNQLRSTLKQQITRTINHFLTPGNGYDAQKSSSAQLPRLASSGLISSYSKLYEHSPAKATQRNANDLISALSYAYHCKDLFEGEDRRKLRHFQNAITRPVVKSAQRGITTAADVWMNAIAHYQASEEHRFPTPANGFIGYSKVGGNTSESDNMLSIYQWQSPGNYLQQTGFSNAGFHWDIMIVGNFDEDNEEEIGLYRREDGLTQIYDSGEPYIGDNSNGYLSFYTNEDQFEFATTVDNDLDGSDEIVFYRPGRGDNIFIYKADTESPLLKASVKDSKRVTQIISGDFDQDGKPELALYDTKGQIRIYNAEDLSPESEVEIADQDFDFMATIDYDNDGFDEIIFSRQSDNRVSIYRHLSETPINSGRLEIDEPFTVMTTGDFDQDGKGELLFYLPESGQVQIYNPGLTGTGDDEAAIYEDQFPYLVAKINTGVKGFESFLPIRRLSRSSN